MSTGPIVATENRVKTAQQIENTLNGYTNRIDQIRDPGSYGGTPSAVELGWHYYLGGLDSGIRPIMVAARTMLAPGASHNPMPCATSIPSWPPIRALDTTPPTVFIPQRYPYDPGSTNFGAEYQ